MCVCIPILYTRMAKYIILFEITVYAYILRSYSADTSHSINIGLTLIQRRRRWSTVYDVGSALNQH